MDELFLHENEINYLRDQKKGYYKNIIIIKINFKKKKIFCRKRQITGFSL